MKVSLKDLHLSCSEDMGPLNNLNILSFQDNKKDLVRSFHSLPNPSYNDTGYWPAPPDDPQGIRVASVIEFSVCLFVSLFILSKFSNFYTVQYSRVQYSTV